MLRRAIAVALLGLMLPASALAQPDATRGDAEMTARTEATRRVAMPFLHRMFIENDVRGAYDGYAAPDFIQHNPRIADGLAGHRAYFAALAQQPGGRPQAWAHVTNMVLVDGDLFALHHQVFRGPDDPGHVFVDIWRVADGRIVEHWDVIQDIPAEMANPNGMGCGVGDTYETARARTDSIDAPACGLPDRRIPRQASLDIFERYVAQVGAGDVRGAIDRWLHESYRQHSPTIADGSRGALAYLMEEWGRAETPKPVLGPARMVIDGDFVLVHRLVTYPGAEGQSANVDIFRMTDGKISAHWDIKQPVPPAAANANGMW